MYWLKSVHTYATMGFAAFLFFCSFPFKQTYMSFKTLYILFNVKRYILK